MTAKSKSGKSLKSITDAEAAYIAGIIDGEGCLSISRKRDHTGMRDGICYRMTVNVSNTAYPLLRWLKSTTGLGSIQKAWRPSLRHKPAWRWDLWSQQARQLLERVEPFLIIKRQRCRLALDFIAMKRDGVGRTGLSDKEWKRQIACHAKMAILNKRGAL